MSLNGGLQAVIPAKLGFMVAPKPDLRWVHQQLGQVDGRGLVFVSVA
ncbi:hypothetical protein L6R46_22600 [Myxococcota bacterium]|nr:hypothetical protein [Myxococcota bacterium]